MEQFVSHNRWQAVLAACWSFGLLAAVFPLTVAANDRAPTEATVPMRLMPVAVTRDILYCNVPDDPDRKRHELDVYRPKGKNGCPVLFFVHGGAWMTGWKDDVLGIYGYGTIAESLARRGIVVVMPNYRLSPAVRHPEHIKDVARAFAWTSAHIREFGGDPRRTFVAGHSAGSHLVSLLVTDESYLKAEGLDTSNIRGVIAISGVYCLNDLALDMTFGCPEKGVSVELRASPLYPIFGVDPEQLKQASPLAHVRPGLPPFLLLNASLDYCPLRRMTDKFAAALKEKGCVVRTREIPWRTHETILFDVPHLDLDATTRSAILGFIAEVEQGSARSN